MNVKIEQIESIDCLLLGEGPHWDPSTKSLYFVDIEGETIHKYTPAVNEHTKARIQGNGGKISLILPIREKPNQYVISIDRKLGIATWDGKSGEAIFDLLTEVETLEHLVSNRINDGKCDSLGRIWFGTIAPNDQPGNVPPNASFYSFATLKVQKHFSGVKISNGLAWNSDNTKFYYIDSTFKCIYVFDFDLEAGTLANRKVLFDLPRNGIEGFPDGMTIDTAGNLWVAVFDGSCILQISSTEENKLLRKIEMPAKQITSVCFGGDKLDELYVTTARMDPLLHPPKNGGLYKITNLGFRGSLGNNALVK